MGGRVGRPPAPTALKVIRGDRPSRINTAEPIPAIGDVTAPEWLSSQAREVWDRLAPDLIAKQVLTGWDVDTFAVYCDAVARHREAAKLVASEGLLVEGQRGGQVKHPAAQLVRDYAAIMTTYGGRFGLTPSDRASLNVGSPEAQQPGADLLSG